MYRTLQKIINLIKHLLMVFFFFNKQSKEKGKGSRWVFLTQHLLMVEYVPEK